MKRTSKITRTNPVTVKGKPYNLTKTGKIRKQHPFRGKIKPYGPQKKEYAPKQLTAVKKTSHRKHNSVVTGDEFLLMVGKRLYQLRYKRNMSQRLFGKLIGINNSKLSKMENGKVNFTLLTLHEICLALNIKPKQFWTF